jgi:DNA-binding SARP family transcriptional activator/Tfp pilus assembly protein PilF
MRFGLLGTVAVVRDDAALPVRAAMPRTVLAALLLDANRVVPAGRLAEALWGDHPPASWAASLHNHVSRLRVSLGNAGSGRIEAVAPGYRIEVLEGELDLEVFAALSERGQDARQAGDWVAAARDLRAALALWRGEPIADVESAALQAVEATRLAELRLKVLEERIDADLRLGREENIVAELGPLIAAYPLRERFHGFLMRACYRTGRQGEALAAYRHARDLLREELGVEPGNELQQLHQRILAADPGLDATSSGPGTAGPPAAPAQIVESAGSFPVPSQLPADIVDFTGRDEQVRVLDELLTGQDAERPSALVVSAVTGTGGIGKTTLAVHVAHRIRGRFPDGQLYVNLRGTSEPVKPADVLARFLRDLDVDPARVPVEEEERAGLLRTLLSGRSMLIVLDNARDTAQVRPLLPGSAQCAVLVTSRNRLPDLPSAHLDLDIFDDGASLALFTAILGADRAAAEPAAVARLVRLTAGLPLAIRIAAARLATRPAWSVAALADRLADQRRRLSELQIGDLAVRASFQLSYDGLREASPAMDPARAFRLLGLVAGADLCLPGAAALLGADQDHTQEVLETLVDAHLLQSASAGRYRLHDLLHVYAVERARAEETRAGQYEQYEAVRRLIIWYLHTADAAAQVLEPRIQRAPMPAGESYVQPLEFRTYHEAMAWCETERGNLVAAVSQAARCGMHAYAWRLPVALRRFFRLGKYWAEWIATYEIALVSATIEGDRRGLGWILYGLGEPYTDLGQHNKAIGYLEEALDIQREIGDRQDEARTLTNLGVNFGMLGKFEESLAYLLQALAILRDAGNRYAEAITLQNIGDTMVRLRRYEEAISYLQQALTFHQEKGDKYNQASTLNSIAEFHRDLGHYDDAARSYRQALRYCRLSRDRGGEATALQGLGNVLLRLGHPDTARRSWLQAREIFGAIGDPRAHDIDARLSLLQTSTGRAGDDHDGGEARAEDPAVAGGGVPPVAAGTAEKCGSAAVRDDHRDFPARHLHAQGR